MPGTQRGNNVVIGAGSVVTKDIPDNSIACGNPCKVICTYDEYLEKVTAQMDEWYVIDKTPEQIMDDNDSINKLKKAGMGFIR